MEAVYHLRIKEERAAKIIEKLIKADAAKKLVEKLTFKLTPKQENAVDDELVKIEKDDTYLME